MINVARVLNGPRFRQSFTVYRKTISFIQGGTSESETPIPMSGAVVPTDAIDLQMLAEGDRQEGSMTFYTTTQLLETTTSGTSDEILWRGNRWRVMKVPPYVDYGYWKAIAVKMDPSSAVTP